MLGERPCLTLRLRNNEVFHLDVAKSPAYAKLSLDPVIEYGTIAALDSHALVMPIRSMLLIELLEAAVSPY